MSCKDRFAEYAEQERAASRVAAGQVDAAPRCTYLHCGRPLNKMQQCPRGHPQDRATARAAEAAELAAALYCLAGDLVAQGVLRPDYPDLLAAEERLRGERGYWQDLATVGSLLRVCNKMGWEGRGFVAGDPRVRAARAWLETTVVDAARLREPFQEQPGLAGEATRQMVRSLAAGWEEDQRMGYALADLLPRVEDIVGQLRSWRDQVAQNSGVPSAPATPTVDGERIRQAVQGAVGAALGGKPAGEMVVGVTVPTTALADTVAAEVLRRLGLAAAQARCPECGEYLPEQGAHVCRAGTKSAGQVGRAAATEAPAGKPAATPAPPVGEASGPPARAETPPGGGPPPPKDLPDWWRVTDQELSHYPAETVQEVIGAALQELTPRAGYWQVQVDERGRVRVQRDAALPAWPGYTRRARQEMAGLLDLADMAFANTFSAAEVLRLLRQVRVVRLVQARPPAAVTRLGTKGVLVVAGQGQTINYGRIQGSTVEIVHVHPTVAGQVEVLDRHYEDCGTATRAGYYWKENGGRGDRQCPQCGLFLQAGRHRCPSLEPEPITPLPYNATAAAMLQAGRLFADPAAAGPQEAARAAAGSLAEMWAGLGQAPGHNWPALLADVNLVTGHLRMLAVRLEDVAAVTDADEVLLAGGSSLRFPQDYVARAAQSAARTLIAAWGPGKKGAASAEGLAARRADIAATIGTLHAWQMAVVRARNITATLAVPYVLAEIWAEGNFSPQDRANLQTLLRRALSRAHVWPEVHLFLEGHGVAPEVAAAAVARWREMRKGY